MIRAFLIGVLALGLAACSSAERPELADFASPAEFEAALAAYEADQAEALERRERRRLALEQFVSDRVDAAHAQGIELVELAPDQLFWIDTACGALILLSAWPEQLPADTPQNVAAACTQIRAIASDAVPEPESSAAPVTAPPPPVRPA